MRTPTTTMYKAVKLKKPNGLKTWMIHRRSQGKRERIYFESEREAKKEAFTRNQKIEAHGTTVNLTPEEQIFAQACMAELAKVGKTLRDATDYFLQEFGRPPAISGNELMDRIMEEYHRRLAAGEISRRHLETARETIGKFRLQFGETPIDKITAGDIKDWLVDLGLAVKTRNRHWGYISSMFQIAAREWELLEKNPLTGVKRFSSPRNGYHIQVYTPEELQLILTKVPQNWLPFFTINAFTGLRRTEVERLDWSEVKLERRLIDLPFTKSKNGRRKLIQVPDNLAHILQPLAQPTGPAVDPKGVNWQIRLLSQAGIKWLNNGLRHSFCSYAVALHGFVWTAEQADHSETMLKKHYREVVTKEDAERYFRIGL
jgi:integrase